MSDPSLPEDPPRDGEWPMSLVGASLWATLITVLFVWLLAMIVAARPAAQFDLVTTFGCQAVAYLLGLFGILRLHAPRASIRDFLGLRPTHPGFYPIAVLLGLSLAAPVNAAYELIERRWPSPREGDAELVRLIVEGSPAERVVLGLVLVALGPALEEVLFRGALTRPLRRRYAPALVIAATAILFALAHLEPQKFLPIALFGAALGALRHASGSLLPAVLLHATYNAIPFGAMIEAASRGGPVDPAAALEGPANAESRRALMEGPSLPVWVVAASASVAAILLVLAFVLAARAGAVARDRERDQA
jgi:membrane protease YdiL (CAAX protease family)